MGIMRSVGFMGSLRRVGRIDQDFRVEARVTG